MKVMFSTNLFYERLFAWNHDYLCLLAGFLYVIGISAIVIFTVIVFNVFIVRAFFCFLERLWDACVLCLE